MSHFRRGERRDPVAVSREALAVGWTLPEATEEGPFQDRIVIPRLKAAGYRIHVVHDSRTEHWAADSGWPDIFAVKGRVAVALELKSRDGRPTDEQRHWLRDLAGVREVRAATVYASPDVVALEELIR
ncbi:MAG TPA: hypothetical protein VK600_01305 [Candidatus Saccharimonadales bacterium]|nr:hypothetical protein [Candidatus Saccharimonadales bacterium]